ncbi:MAG: glycosyltransferase [Bryobacter sp.]|nr:glycosyltransferase [Bryobacter sp.]
MKLLLRLLAHAPYVLSAPLLALVQGISFLLLEAAWLLFGKAKTLPAEQPDNQSASVVIPNWNGRDLLEKYLPSVVAALAGNPRNEVIVVDNGSIDGSVDYLRTNFPTVRVLALPQNLGFGGGSNAGFAAAKNDIVVLLNSDMRVAPDFLPPLLACFHAPDIFAVSCQIFFSDPQKAREETGLTEGQFRSGMLRVRHRVDEDLQVPFPCFYAGGGSSAFDRKKFLALGGFDEILAPFYLEDTDLGFLAWKVGWRVLYQPASHVWHEHRGTIGKKFSQSYIDSIVAKNFLLFLWKNLASFSGLCQHLFAAHVSALLSVLLGNSRERCNYTALWKASLQLPGALRARWRVKTITRLDDKTAFARHRGAHYFDQYLARQQEEGAQDQNLRVLMVSPYPLCPPSHGGAVFMQQTVRALAQHAKVHLIALLDEEWERFAHDELAPFLTSANFIVRMTGQSSPPFTYTPGAVLEFANEDLAYLIHRTIYLERINVLQLEYTNMAQYGARLRHIVCALFEHDVYFQSIARQIKSNPSWLFRIPALLEYAKAFRWELQMLPRFDQVQVCTIANQRYLESLSPQLQPLLRAGLRAAIEVQRHSQPLRQRAGKQLLFLGGFRHLPNLEALQWFFREVVPCLIEKNADFEVVAIGAEPPPLYGIPHAEPYLELKGFVEDLAPYWASAAVFICPILSGSGVRVKLLEAFAAGAPVVSTRVGAEGLADKDGEYCRLADTPQAFAAAILDLLANPEEGLAMAQRARAYVEAEWDNQIVTARLADSYRALLAAKRQA